MAALVADSGFNDELVVYSGSTVPFQLSVEPAIVREFTFDVGEFGAICRSVAEAEIETDDTLSAPVVIMPPVRTMEPLPEILPRMAFLKV